MDRGGQGAVLPSPRAPSLRSGPHRACGGKLRPHARSSPRSAPGGDPRVRPRVSAAPAPRRRGRASGRRDPPPERRGRGHPSAQARLEHVPRELQLERQALPRRGVRRLPRGHAHGGRRVPRRGRARSAEEAPGEEAEPRQARAGAGAGRRRRRRQLERHGIRHGRLLLRQVPPALRRVQCAAGADQGRARRAGARVAHRGQGSAAARRDADRVRADGAHASLGVPLKVTRRVGLSPRRSRGGAARPFSSLRARAPRPSAARRRSRAWRSRASSREP